MEKSGILCILYSDRSKRCLSAYCQWGLRADDGSCLKKKEQDGVDKNKKG